MTVEEVKSVDANSNASDVQQDIVSTDEQNVQSDKKRVSDGLKSVFVEFVGKLKKFRSARFSAAYITKLAFLTAIAFVLYSYAKFPMPSIFPFFLDMQLSELPALLAGFSMGPISGVLVIIFKCLLKMAAVPSSTGFAGELTDMLLGILFVLPASLVYHMRADKTDRISGMRHALLGLFIGTLMLTAMSLVVNRYISIPIYSKLYGFDNIVKMVTGLYEGVTEGNFYTYYLLLGVLPFNLLRCIIVSALTFLLYKRLSVILHWEGNSLIKEKPLLGKHRVKSAEDTYKIAGRLAEELNGGEVILLNGELGAGKTTFVKGLAKALGIADEVTSPTFTILNVYDGDIRLNHLDMYRIESEDELEELGLDSCFAPDAVTAIEWNKFGKLYGKVYRVDIAYVGENSRDITISSEGEDNESVGDRHDVK